MRFRKRRNRPASVSTVPPTDRFYPVRATATREEYVLNPGDSVEISDSIGTTIAVTCQRQDDAPSLVTLVSDQAKRLATYRTLLEETYEATATVVNGPSPVDAAGYESIARLVALHLAIRKALSGGTDPKA